jgi:hypothetical protein
MQQQSKRSNRVDVFRLRTFDRRQGSPHGRAIYDQILCITRAEAGVMVHRGYAVWRGPKQRAITILVPKNALLLYIGQMRFKGTPEARGLDSKTHKRLPGIRGYAHVRTNPYGYEGSRVTQDPMADEFMFGYLSDIGASNQAMKRVIPEFWEKYLKPDAG